jgi:hypothetical protein
MTRQCRSCGHSKLETTEFFPIRKNGLGRTCFVCLNHNRQVHGHANTPTYNSWRAMKTRCSNPEHDKWLEYGGRGIRVCARWKRSFSAFLFDMGERPDGATLDRIDPDGNYKPGNCRWATPWEQRANQRSASPGVAPELRKIRRYDFLREPGSQENASFAGSSDEAL